MLTKVYYLHSYVVFVFYYIKTMSDLWSRTFIVVLVSHTSICLPFKQMPYLCAVKNLLHSGTVHVNMSFMFVLK